MAGEDLNADAVTAFRGYYRFLSNFYSAPVKFDDDWYNSSEHAYQAAKTMDRTMRAIISRQPTAGAAKSLGKSVRLRDDWEQVKIDVMLEILRSKFRSGELRQALEATGNMTLVEGNTWGDTFWGVCEGEGENWLGKCLMQVREENRNGN